MATSLFAVGFLGVVVTLLTRYISIRWRRREMMRSHNCQPIVQYPATERFGSDYDRIVKESFQNGRMNKTAMEQYEKCGSSTFEVRAVNERVIVTSDPENLKAIHLRMDDWVRDVRPAGFPFMGKDNVLNQNGAAWEHSRAMANPLFKRAELREVENFGKFVDRFITLIPRDGQTHDLQPLIRKLFLDHSSEFVFGESLDSLRYPDNAEKFRAAFARAHSKMGNRVRPTGLKLWLNNLGTWDKEWLSDCQIVHGFIDDHITRYRNRILQGKEQSKHYVLIEGMSEAYPDPVVLRFQLLGIFASALQNGAMLFANCLFLLARNPHEWTKLRKQALAFDSDKITFEQLHGLSDFRYTVQETLRMHTPVPRTRRKAAQDTILPRGGGVDGTSPTFVAKGTTIWGDRYPKSYDPEIWGEDVDVFRPLRFQGRQLGWEFRPFGGGPRVCPASQQVISQCMYLLFRLVREFEAIENGDPCLEFIEGVQMCLESKNGVKIALLPAHQ